MWMVAFVVGAAGCEIYKAPDRVRALESRVNELSAEVSALTGRPVGVGKHVDDHAGSGSDAGSAHEGAEHAEHDKETDKKKDREDHDTKVAEPEHPAPANPADVHWSYSGEAGPQHWGDLSPAFAACGEGTAQSPVDLAGKSTASPIVFDYKPTDGRVIDNGHTLQVNLDPGSSIAIDGTTYQLLQFHFHTPSEHTLGGEQYPLELHLVHKSAEGKLAVIGVMFDAGADTGPLAAVWAKWPKQPGVEAKLKKKLDPSALVPESRTVLRYDGSLTTPPCSEGVVWNVMRRPRAIAPGLLTAFKLRYPLNARPIQELGDRTVK